MGGEGGESGARGDVHAAATAKVMLNSGAGFCAVTEFGGSCDEDESGAWQIRSAEACRQACMACSGCSYVSFSAGMQDCSWFRRCTDLNHLDQGKDLIAAHGIRTYARECRQIHIHDPLHQVAHLAPPHVEAIIDRCDVQQNGSDHLVPDAQFCAIDNSRGTGKLSDDLSRHWLKHWELDLGSLLEYVAHRALE